MEDLSAADLRAVLTQVQRLHEAPSLATFPRKLLACLRALVPSDIAAYEEVNPIRQRTVGENDPPDARPSAEQIGVWEQHMGEHPVVQQFLTTEDRRSRAISDHLSRDAFHRTGIYNEF